HQSTMPATVRLSILSIRPPWPGIMSPLSLTAKRRLTALSPRSPNCPEIETTTEISRPIAKGDGVSSTHPARNHTRIPLSVPAHSPPAAPDQVLDGDTSGESFVPPTIRPTK